jgi:hypothetical protein
MRDDTTPTLEGIEGVDRPDVAAPQGASTGVLPPLVRDLIHNVADVGRCRRKPAEFDQPLAKSVPRRTISNEAFSHD